MSGRAACAPADRPANIMKTHTRTTPVAKAAPGLSREEIERYNRHLIMPEVGTEGQRKLKEAGILIVGAGGLGSPAVMYLAAAGIGRIGLVDHDVVDRSNLQRQIIHGTGDIGRSKLESARDTILEINPHVQVDIYQTVLTPDNALQILAPYDIVLDGSDNFPTRYLINDACVLLHKPDVYGSVFRFEGQASVFHAERGPCYRCLYPAPPPPDLAPSCAEGGVLGVLPGTIGMVQATEALKQVLGIGKPLIGRLLIYDALAMTFDEIRLRKRPDCLVCSQQPTITELIDYEMFCGAPAHDNSAVVVENGNPIPSITPRELWQRLQDGDDLRILDVREPDEWRISNLAAYGATLIPMDELLDRLDELDLGRKTVVLCRSGARSAAIVAELQDIGYRNLLNLEGGINRWAMEVDPALSIY